MLFDDRTVLGVPAEKRGAVMVFQEHALFPFRTVRENLEFGLRIRKIERSDRRARISEALSAVRLKGFEDRWPDELSGGERQRVALARALVVRPGLLLLDEPLSSLEPGLRADLRDTIAAVQREVGITTVLVTHDQIEAVALADRIALMIDGRIRQTGLPTEFFDRPRDAEVARFFGAGNFLFGEKRGGRVSTEIGTLDIGDCDVADGPVLLTIRPEAIEVASEASNCFPATIDSSRFGGVVTDCVATIRGVQMHFVTSRRRCPVPGDVVSLHLPPAAIRVLQTADGSGPQP